jgi:hypothetical protein
MGPATAIISDFDTVIRSIEIHVPEKLLGKTLSQISASPPPTAGGPQKKKFKCYTINPETDIQGDQILIDPTTGQSLVNTMEERQREWAGGNFSAFQSPSGLLPGDIEYIATVTIIVISSIGLFTYISSIMYWTLYTEPPPGSMIKHFIIFIVLLIALIVFSVETDPGHKNSHG